MQGRYSTEQNSYGLPREEKKWGPDCTTAMIQLTLAPRGHSPHSPRWVSGGSCEPKPLVHQAPISSSDPMWLLEPQAILVIHRQLASMNWGSWIMWHWPAPSAQVVPVFLLPPNQPLIIQTPDSSWTQCQANNCRPTFSTYPRIRPGFWPEITAHPRPVEPLDLECKHWSSGKCCQMLSQWNITLYLLE